MTKRKAKGAARPSTQSPSIPLLVAGVLIAAGVLLILGLSGRSGRQQAAKPTPAGPTASPASAAAAAVKSAGLCRRQPLFSEKLGFSKQAVIGTSVRGFTGLSIVDPSANQAYQDPTWDDAGNLGAYVLDGAGNVWAAPAPLTSLELNPPEQQNKIYKVDTNTGRMAEALDLPKAQPPSEFNPFGIVGLGYDCDTNSLYAASLAGSTPTQEVGRIFRIDLATGQVADQIDGVDAMGVGVAVTPEGKRLYYGLARSSEVRSVPLDAQGNFGGESRSEFALATLPGGRNERAQRITFNDKGEMRVKGIDFTYSLQVSGQTVPTIYLLSYDASSGKWQVLDVRKEESLLGSPP